MEIQKLRPPNMLQAMGLARLEEEKLEVVARGAKTPSFVRNISKPPSNSANMPSLIKIASFAQVTTASQRSLPLIQCLTLAEMEKRRVKKLYYNCDEKYTRGHICKRHQLFLLEAEEGEPDGEEPPSPKDQLPEQAHEEFQVSVHSIIGSSAHHTMRIKGYIKKTRIIILINSGSTHNFLDPKLAKQSGCDIHETLPLTVAIANGSRLVSSTMCRRFKWVMQGTTFEAEIRLLPLGGCDMVFIGYTMAVHTRANHLGFSRAADGVPTK